MPMEYESNQPYEETMKPAWASSVSKIDSTLDAASEARIEDYLDRVGAPMIGRVDYSKRKELRDEMRQHIWSLALAYRELGHDSSSSVEMALEKFGEPGKITRQLGAGIEGGREKKSLRERMGRLLASPLGATGSMVALGLTMGLFGFVLRGSLPVASTAQIATVNRPVTNNFTVLSQDPKFANFKHSNFVGENCISCHASSSGESTRKRAFGNGVPPAATAGQSVPMR